MRGRKSDILMGRHAFKTRVQMWVQQRGQAQLHARKNGVFGFWSSQTASCYCSFMLVFSLLLGIDQTLKCEGVQMKDQNSQFKLSSSDTQESSIALMGHVRAVSILERESYRTRYIGLMKNSSSSPWGLCRSIHTQFSAGTILRM